MKTEYNRKAILMGSAVLIGMVVCLFIWFFLREHKTQSLLVHENSTSSNNEILTENRKVLKEKQDLEGNQNEDSLTVYERIAQRTRRNIMSMYSEKQLATPRLQKKLAVMDSPEYIEFLKSRPNTRMTREFWKSKGVPVPVDQEVFNTIYHNKFETGQPVDYEAEMSVKLAKMFLATDPVELTNPAAAAEQRAKVLLEFNTRKDPRNLAWFLAYFGEDWDGAFQIEFKADGNNPALAWVSNIQQNAASIVAAAEQARVEAIEASAPAWDMSAVMESPSVSSDATTEESPSVSPPAIDALEPPAIPKPETDAAATPAPGLTDVPKTPTNLPTVEGLGASLKEQFSSERFDRAMSTLERYGPEEGLRRLKESDPEVAEQVERHRNQTEISK